MLQARLATVIKQSLWHCRDVKPENIVVEGGQSGGKAYLVDFGSVQVGRGGVRGGISK